MNLGSFNMKDNKSNLIFVFSRFFSKFVVLVWSLLVPKTTASTWIEELSPAFNFTLLRALTRHC